MNLQGLMIFFTMSTSVFIGLLFFEEILTGLGYFNMLRTLIMPKTVHLYGTQKFHSQHDVTSRFPDLPC
jgi:hypothetical protein